MKNKISERQLSITDDLNNLKVTYKNVSEETKKLFRDINKHFIIRCDGKLYSAKSLLKFAKNDKLILRTFKKVLNMSEYECTIKIRCRLKIEFVSK